MPTKAEAPVEAWFYHLEQSSVDQTLPELLEKTIARGWRAMVHCGDPAVLDHLDSWLWSYRDDSFLAHGRGGEANASRQPILLTAQDHAENSADVLFVLDEPPETLASYARCVILFDGADEIALTRARGLWTSYKSAGSAVVYWRQQEASGWTRQG